MAIAGGACTAYTVTLRPDGTLGTRSRAALRSMCVDLDSEPGEAVKKLRNGEALTVAGIALFAPCAQSLCNFVLIL